MKLSPLIPRPEIADNEKLNKAYLQLENLLNSLNKREIPEEIVIIINKDIEELNSISDSGKTLRKQLSKKQSGIITLIEKELKLVTKNHYRNLWMILGMSAIGIPIGVALGAALSNMGLLGIGLPIGMGIGIAIGIEIDKKALEEGRQINLELS